MTETQNQRLAAINCTNCGSALPALAGHRAKALVCSYCGSVMDRHDDYKVLARYRNMERPYGPFTLGMRGEVLGVPHTIVGIVGVAARIWGEDYPWTNYQLYSPTHGYSWLTWNDGHLTHSRKTREMPNLVPNSQFVPKSTFGAAGRTFKMFEQYNARINYIEGELTWVPKLGDQTRVMEAIDPPYGYAVAMGENETEFEMSSYLDQQATLASFGVEDSWTKPFGIHAIQPFEPGALHTGLSRAAMMFVPITAAISLGLLVLGGGKTIAQGQIDNPAAGGSLAFPVTATNRLVSIKIKTNVSNSWAWYDMSLTHEESDETIAEFDGGVEYYYGRDSDGSWTEGSNEAVFRFKPPAKGAYRIAVEGIEKGSDNRPMSIVVREKVMLVRYMVGMFILSLVLAASMWFREKQFEAKRWGEDGSDDDD